MTALTINAKKESGDEDILVRNYSTNDHHRCAWGKEAKDKTLFCTVYTPPPETLL